MWDANVAISQQWKLKVHKILHKHKNHTTGKTKRAKDSNKTIPQLEKPSVKKNLKNAKIRQQWKVKVCKILKQQSNIEKENQKCVIY